jgi:hypothetical protein
MFLSKVAEQSVVYRSRVTSLMEDQLSVWVASLATLQFTTLTTRKEFEKARVLLYCDSSTLMIEGQKST